jgi:hypothetical protein
VVIPCSLEFGQPDIIGISIRVLAEFSGAIGNPEDFGFRTIVPI